jgi:hypothetical protein
MHPLEGGRCLALTKVKDLSLNRVATFKASWVFQEQVPTSSLPPTARGRDHSFDVEIFRTCGGSGANIINRHAAGGSYVVTKQLPERDGEFEYRIKSASESYERVAREGELVRE